MDKSKPTSASILRQNPEYYLNELRSNAIRHKEKNYYLKNPNRAEQITEIRNNYNEETGSGREPKRWTKEELKYLKENYLELPVMKIAKKLGRSWMSVNRKMNREGLTKYHKWNQ